MWRFVPRSLIAVFVAFAAPAHAFEITGTKGTTLSATPLETFAKPWAMTFLPDGKALVTEKGGAMWLLAQDGRKIGPVKGGPSVRARGQGGLGDVILHPNYASNGVVYVSYVERDSSNTSLSGAAVIRATLTPNAGGARLSESDVIWRQSPKVKGNGHYGHRLAFAPDGHLFITSGERQKFDPAQDMKVNLGKVVRLTEMGDVPVDNPFVGQGGVTDQIWSLGHRNPLGIAFAGDGKLWVHEMGPRGGDELNLIKRSANYGYPVVSDGSHYSLLPIPDHATSAAYAKPAISWVPSVSPSGLVIYQGSAFPQWQGDALLGGLSGRALVHVELAGETATEVERFKWGSRVREVEQGPNGVLYVLEDGGEGRLLRIEPGS